MGKIIGGSVGFMLGGPLGAIAGVELGSFYDSGTGARRESLNPGIVKFQALKYLQQPIVKNISRPLTAKGARL